VGPANATFAAEAAKAATINLAAFKVPSTHDGARDETTCPPRIFARRIWAHILCLECFYLMNQ
jgi:hypothetical protein